MLSPPVRFMIAAAIALMSTNLSDAKTIFQRIHEEDRFVVFNSRQLTGECRAICKPTESPSASPSASPTFTFSPSASPSANPSGSFYPSSAPSEVPTDSSAPSVAPSNAPSTTPSEAPSQSSQPTDCYDKYDVDSSQVLHQVGYDLPIPSDGVEIVHSNTTQITMQVNQLWMEESITIFIHYHHAEHHNSVCEAKVQLPYEDSFTATMECFDGWTDVGLFVYFDPDLVLEECNECSAPDQNDENAIAYYLEVPCRNLCGGEELAMAASSTGHRVLLDSAIFSKDHEVESSPSSSSPSLASIHATAPAENDSSHEVVDASSSDQTYLRPPQLPFYLQEIDHS